MQSCSSALCVLILLISTVTTAVPPVRVKLHDSATLPCSERCFGLVRWSVSHKSTDVLAECDQTSCRSVKEGYQMIHDQYLKGNLSLIITEADLTKRGWYTCQCDKKELCDVNLRIEPFNTTVQIEPGESLVLDLDVSDPVKVIYNSTDAANRSSGQICTVDRDSLQCKPEYTQRVSVISALELRAVTLSDNGVYTILTIREEEVIHTYSVTVQGDHSDLDTDKGAAVPVWVIVLSVMGAAVIVGLVVVILLLRRENLLLRMEGAKNRAQMNHHSDHSPGEERLSPHDNE
ncbi:CD276 antigen homolog [Colossoma macropomum]|uniref:CD276 antigen homolog n=1 Tax=Colossoma macropomum TaxID=42526 RepID=UPI001864037E|nr:CD276 antigen homolog [Colossoma macropomum]XP_036454030.1 CD276 antigen homolog [Colossoma macropomum]